MEAFLKCPTKCFLRSGGEAGTGNAYADWVRTKNDIFRIEGTKRLVAEVAPDKCAIGIEAKSKPAQWNLERLHSRSVSTKRSLALREFALGDEALEQFVRQEPLRRVHECVFGVLALESELVDPRL